MASTPTSPTGLLYAALIRRLDAAVPPLAGKIWTMQAPANARPPFAVIKPISGDEAQSFDGPSGLHRKTIQIMVKGTEAAGFSSCLNHRHSIEQSLGGQHFADTIGTTRRVHVDSILPAGDGYEDWDEASRQFVAFVRYELLYRIETITP